MDNLSDIITSKNNNKPVSLRAFVSGKADGSYSVPVSFELNCFPGLGKKCYSDKKQTLLLPNTELIKFVDISERSFKKILQSIFNLSCSVFMYRILKSMSLVRLFIVDHSRKDNKTFTCYLIG